jgi:hypothetical protein
MGEARRSRGSRWVTRRMEGSGGERDKRIRPVWCNAGIIKEGGRTDRADDKLPQPFLPSRLQLVAVETIIAKRSEAHMNGSTLLCCVIYETVSPLMEY